MTEFRFDPRRFQASPAVCWLLGAAFGPPESVGCFELVNPDELLATGDRLDLLQRAGARIDGHVLAASIGKAAGDEIAARVRSTAGHALRVRASTGKVGRIAWAEGIDSVVIKGGALLLLDAVPPGARNVGDLDVLVPKGCAERMQTALIDAGWVASDLPESGHQLPILGHPSGVPVEVHVEIPGVKLGVGNATTEEVIATGLCRQGVGLPEGCRVVSIDLLLAHLIVHGIHQHGLAPGAYPMARMLADVQDLVPSQIEWERFLGGGFRWISHVVSRREAEAVWAVVDRLGGGENPEAVMGGNDDAGSLLQHIVNGALDDEYCQGLNLQNVVRASGDSSWFYVGKKALFLTRGQIDIVYGKPTTELGYLGRRLWRPFDLTLRAWRYGWAWVKHKVRHR